jgi:hypothetical protein
MRRLTRRHGQVAGVHSMSFRPTREQRARLRYWDFFIYWVDYALKKQKGEVQDERPVLPETEWRLR